MAYTIFQQNGVWVQEPDNIDPPDITARMTENKVRWVAGLIQEGMEPLRQDSYIDERWWDRLGPRVVKLGWVNDTHGAGEDVEQLCAIASSLVSRYTLQGIIFDFEKAWEADPNLPMPEQLARWQRWDRFLKEWRRLRPGLLTALSSYAYPPYVAFPWANIAAAKIRYLPQNLYNYAEFYRCPYSIQGAGHVGYPKSYVHFMLSREEGHSLSAGIVDAYKAKRELFPSYKGISAYVAENMTSNDWALMKNTVENGLSGWNP